ncbi:hypothetical protein BDN70DRAFT_297748 [Pholiota conissans]|uniref:Uncharacterized protein n=1 Tax=Pholiota conissans TaxID=109636 RepID=A0A9P6CWL0_9AGAR|nr:hypothetical protein BDN70DRAFT_297748 [Pholiota conissans]
MRKIDDVAGSFCRKLALSMRPIHPLWHHDPFQDTQTERFVWSMMDARASGHDIVPTPFLTRLCTICSSIIALLLCPRRHLRVRMTLDASLVGAIPSRQRSLFHMHHTHEYACIQPMDIIWTFSDGR